MAQKFYQLNGLHLTRQLFGGQTMEFSMINASKSTTIQNLEGHAGAYTASVIYTLGQGSMFVTNCTEVIADGTEGVQGKVIGNVATENSIATGGQLVINGNPRYATTNTNWRTKVVNFGETLRSY